MFVNIFIMEIKCAFIFIIIIIIIIINIIIVIIILYLWLMFINIATSRNLSHSSALWEPNGLVKPRQVRVLITERRTN